MYYHVETHAVEMPWANYHEKNSGDGIRMSEATFQKKLEYLHYTVVSQLDEEEYIVKCSHNHTWKTTRWKIIQEQFCPYCPHNARSPVHLDHLKVSRVIVHGLVSPRDACKMVACDPAVALFGECHRPYFEPYREEIVKHIREINKRMFRKQIFCSVPCVVATTVWDYGLRHHLKWSQEKVGASFHVTAVSLRNLHHKLFPPHRRVY